jgi:hypothetical protein
MKTLKSPLENRWKKIKVPLLQEGVGGVGKLSNPNLTEKNEYQSIKIIFIKKPYECIKT